MSEEIVHVEEETPEELRLTHKMVDKFLKISGEVSGQDCIVVDDMIDTGSTIRLALEVLHSHKSGENNSKLDFYIFSTCVLFRRVYVFATHGIFSGTCKMILQECPNLEKVFLFRV